MTCRVVTVIVMVAILAWVGPASAVPFFFNSGNPDGLMATASRPSSAGKIEIETADDFVVSGGTLKLTSATFQGLLPTGSQLSNVTQVVVEIYRVFPNDSTNPPSTNVPTRVNSPSDVAFDSRDSGSGTLSFTPGFQASSFTAANSVLNGINKFPNQKTLGEGAVTGQQVQFNVLFNTPFVLPADHYFFVPQVQLTSGDFFWLSAARPIVPPGTPFPPGATDLQSWIRDENLDPDWLRIGTDIVGAGAFNAAFTVNGDLDPVPEPATLTLLATTMAGLGAAGWRRRRAG
ncbi:MAG TPA: PEP-CTERM sorting domain-containing protein [Methylomirabilota bacterium]|nr:PEP-CTERM sorting domain-containing protein [Methylomirabilota bacterium]